MRNANTLQRAHVCTYVCVSIDRECAYVCMCATLRKMVYKINELATHIHMYTHIYMHIRTYKGLLCKRIAISICMCDGNGNGNGNGMEKANKLNPM